MKIEVDTLTGKQWDKVVEALSGQALFTAKLLAGEMPTDIEEMFAKTKVSLFPQHQEDLMTDCSCPDWSNPCKHVAAVYYLLGEEFDRDPFLLFRLRGLGRDELLQRLSRLMPAPEAVPYSAETTAEGSGGDRERRCSRTQRDSGVGVACRPTYTARLRRRRCRRRGFGGWAISRSGAEK